MKTSCKTIGLLALVIFLASFLTAKSKYPHYKPIDTLCEKIEKQCAKDLDLTTIGRGGSMVHDIKSVAHTFIIHDQLDIEKSRSLAVRCANLFLSRINADKKVRPFLHQYPFTNNNLDIQISVFDKDTHEHPPPPSIAFVSVRAGSINYYTNAHPSEPFKLVKKESYKDALELVQHQVGE